MDFIGLPNTAQRKLQTEGNIVVGLLDTGINPESESFKDDGFGPLPKKWKGTCGHFANFSGCNKKIIGARHFKLDRNPDPNDILSPIDVDGHGTHTSSTVAGNQVPGASLFGLARGDARGAVPAARVAMYKDLFMKSSLDSIFKILIGVELDSLCGSYEEGIKFCNAFDDANALSLWRYVDVLWKIKRFLNIGSEATLKKHIKVVDDFVYKQINSKLEQMHNLKDDFSKKKDDILSRFMQVNQADPTYLRDVVLNFVIAGRDTTSATLSWFIYMLCKNPAVQEKVAKEVREVTEGKQTKNFADFATSVDEEALEKMNYLHATITETLRLYPAVPVDAKTCFADDIMPDGFSVSRGDMVAYIPYGMGRMKFIWGDDAEEYKPERWLNEDGVFRQQSPFKFTAFQAGPRICLGKEFAYMQMKIFSAVLLDYFIFKLRDENKPVNCRTTFNLRIDGGLHVYALDR
ncbi:hypothetical protein GH714_019453 [Hevea brasiliensis]|uniref:Peptidase S8/S53 domain-containing protein n=1 Tax=Hevea brasiliensis TaxID=3981 RepID=A0A6A6MFD0_HEVBR|nr:hypothetical protein GH714_019453 [Hevea brasiliensis]